MHHMVEEKQEWLDDLPKTSAKPTRGSGKRAKNKAKRKKP
jgi:hypothetical protein